MKNYLTFFAIFFSCSYSYNSEIDKKNNYECIIYLNEKANLLNKFEKPKLDILNRSDLRKVYENLWLKFKKICKEIPDKKLVEIRHTVNFCVANKKLYTNNKNDYDNLKHYLNLYFMEMENNCKFVKEILSNVVKKI